MNEYIFIGGNVIDPSIIEELEAELGVVFPDDYKSVILQHNGASIVPFAFKVGEMVESINNFHKVDEKYHFSDERLPDGIIPFARDAGDNQICFDYREGNISILFWDYGSPKNDGLDLSLIANSFKEFLDMLFEFDE
ncbi:SMI1/KNR4 family protein [Oceanirhabdus sp. W0125-5]|uniref:SMI1/KNR4 family protein n=1 Tax=Oceanirhabdus sp. W0125-5 TaxID=2999116 RepID=UPI0022F340B0|nr:SMI1/KNR4 family protein [Oceanirhabdus sp. W0125-5]WBW95933.1 SMI1/KNR4 family protein [Oceanirhabdus sp. W0125-5]